MAEDAKQILEYFLVIAQFSNDTLASVMAAMRSVGKKSAGRLPLIKGRRGHD